MSTDSAASTGSEHVAEPEPELAPELEPALFAATVDQLGLVNPLAAAYRVPSAAEMWAAASSSEAAPEQS